MEKNWKRVHSTASLQEAELIKAKLDSEEIIALVLNKKDQSYSSFGDVEVYVYEDAFEAAKQIVSNFFED